MSITAPPLSPRHRPRRSPSAPSAAALGLTYSPMSALGLAPTSTPGPSQPSSTSPTKSTPSSPRSPSSDYLTGNGLPSPGHRARSQTITLSGRSRGSSKSNSKSAPVSPSGRFIMQGLTPISGISGMQLEQSMTAQQQQQQQMQYQHQQQQYLQAQLNAQAQLQAQRTAHASAAAPGQSQRPQQGFQYPLQPAKPPHVQSQSLPSTYPIHSIPSPGIQQHQAASSSAQTMLRPTPSSSTKVRRNHTLGRNAEDSANDSDATVRPRAGGKGSLSQPDLTELRSKRVEGWADGVMRENKPSTSAQGASGTITPTEERRKPSYSRKTPPTRQIPIPQAAPHHVNSNGPDSRDSWLPASPVNSRSQPSLTSLKRSPSPRNSQLSIPTMSPIIDRTPLSSSDDEYRGFPFTGHFNRPGFGGAHGGSFKLGGGMSSEDADDDYESTDSPSSGSLTFSPKRNQYTSGLRQRFPMDKVRGGLQPAFGGLMGTLPGAGAGGLGLSLNPALESPTSVSSPGLSDSAKDHSFGHKIATKLEHWFARSTLLPLRLLAIVPSLWGISVLARGLATGGVWYDVWPWGVDLSRESLERLLAGGGWNEGTWRNVRRGDAAISIAWAICTAHFCFSLTTGLTHRWRSYYSLPSTITRLVSLQCLCWPATYLTLLFLGAERLLLCWVVIGVTTGWSRTIQMWVTSNVIPADTLGGPTDQGRHDSQALASSSTQSSSTLDATSAGDLTPNLRRRGSKAPALGVGPPEIPEGLTTWEAFKWGRKWDWDNVAREVGWKVGGLLLVTTAWLFWGIEEGKVLRL
ncbi:hypothetical protein IAU60_006166 [Kwoniella sp. DSM 27419]